MKYHPVNIVTINVRGFNDPIKQFQVTNYIKLMHLDIIGLSELHMTNTNFGKNLRFTSNKNYEYIWATNGDKTDPASGCVLVIKKDLAKHIQKITTFKGRLIVADFYFKRFNRIRIIHVYVSSTKQMNWRKELAKELRIWVNEGYQKNIKIIVLGDFNENMDHFLDRKTSGKSTNSHIFCFLNLINQ